MFLRLTSDWQVIVYDLVARQPIAHFQAHSQSISTLVFDPTGTLVSCSLLHVILVMLRCVCTVSDSVSGWTQLSCLSDNSEECNRHPAQLQTSVPVPVVALLTVCSYKLQRGITNATIQDIRFSADSRWLAVSSTRGTTRNEMYWQDRCWHDMTDIFAINPTGGAVNAHTHLRAASSRTNQELQLLLSEQSPHVPVTCHHKYTDVTSHSQ